MKTTSTSMTSEETGETTAPQTDSFPVTIQCRIEELFYGDFLAVRDSQVNIKKNNITAFIGPSGCGKSTVLRCINRMNDLIRSFRFKGELLFHGTNIYDSSIDPVAVRCV
jgi:phosphate transport system ATP-binding protein